MGVWGVGVQVTGWCLKWEAAEKKVQDWRAWGRVVPGFSSRVGGRLCP